MAFVKKTWQARIGTGLNKFRVGDLGTFELTNTPDEITQQGDALSASNLNDLENRIDTGCVHDVRTPDGTSLVSGGVATVPVKDIQNSSHTSVIDPATGVATLPAIPAEVHLYMHKTLVNFQINTSGWSIRYYYINYTNFATAYTTWNDVKTAGVAAYGQAWSSGSYGYSTIGGYLDNGEGTSRVATGGLLFDATQSLEIKMITTGGGLPQISISDSVTTIF